MISDELIDEACEAVRRRAVDEKRYPVSVYRLQFNHLFTFRDATRLVAYLHELGITDCYASPYLKARPGSLHGYDISEHNALNPEIGTEKDYQSFVRELKKHGMGQVLDFVPNHMGIFNNPWWQDILKNGHSSPYSRFFDIQWEPIKPELFHRVLFPILEDFYGNVLERGQLKLDYYDGSFFIRYHDNQFPVDTKTMTVILEPALKSVQPVLGNEHPEILELQSIISECRNLPSRNEANPERVAERLRETEVVQRRLSALVEKNKDIRQAIAVYITEINGKVGDSASFSQLHQLLEKQAYRLSYWRVAEDEINYRRFFDINELISLRMQDPYVFKETHRLLRHLISTEAVTGVRIDHIDGLFDPADYLWQLQKAVWIDRCLQMLEQHIDSNHHERVALEEKLSQRFDEMCRENSVSMYGHLLFTVVEKILTEKEVLPPDWPVDGTVGYEFIATLNETFVDRKHRRSMLDIYKWFACAETDFDEVTYRAKNLVMSTTMSAEINVLANQLSKLAEQRWQYRDFTLNSLRDAIRECIACFPVYRTYINAYKDQVSERDRSVVTNTIHEARRRNPAMSAAIFDFLRNTILLSYPPGISENGRNDQRSFVMRFQQFTGPVMAKGMEDTAFYIYYPLVSLCEVGGYPQRFGTSVEEFHRQNIRRNKMMPHTFIPTSTHDSKRGEDVRARINVISEIPREWRSALQRWNRINSNRKSVDNGGVAPENNDEYLLYQTLLGTYPVHEMDNASHIAYIEKIKTYMIKAVREAKVHTSWINPDEEYEQAVTGFTDKVLEKSDSNAFLADFSKLNQIIVTCGWYNSLAQLVLKFFSAGAPDIYHGNELWNYTLTDPDNRQPVNYDVRTQYLKQLKAWVNSSNLADVAVKLMERIADGDIKLYVTWRSLNYRRDNADLFNEGSYIPLKVAGAKKNHCCAFAWKKGASELIVIAPRLVAGLTGNAASLPLGSEVWGDTRILFPPRVRSENFSNIFTGENVGAGKSEHGTYLFLADALRLFPVAALETTSD